MNKDEIEKLIRILNYMNMRISYSESEGNNEYGRCQSMIDDLRISIENRTTL